MYHCVSLAITITVSCYIYKPTVYNSMPSCLLQIDFNKEYYLLLLQTNIIYYTIIAARAYYRCSRQFSLAASTRAHQIKLAVVYRALHGTAPQYMLDRRQYVAYLPTRRRGLEAGCACRPLVFSTSARRSASLSAITLLLLLAHNSGTVYLSTSSLPHHSQHFIRSWKLIYFGNHTQTLFCNCVAIVVLEVTFTQPL